MLIAEYLTVWSILFDPTSQNKPTVCNASQKCQKQHDKLFWINGYAHKGVN